MPAYSFLDRHGPTGMAAGRSTTDEPPTTLSSPASGAGSTMVGSLGGMLSGPTLEQSQSIERLLVPTKAWASKIGINTTPDIREQRRLDGAEEVSTGSRNGSPQHMSRRALGDSAPVSQQHSRATSPSGSSSLPVGVAVQVERTHPVGVPLQELTASRPQFVFNHDSSMWPHPVVQYGQSNVMLHHPHGVPHRQLHVAQSPTRVAHSTQMPQRIGMPKISY